MLSQTHHEIHLPIFAKKRNIPSKKSISNNIYCDSKSISKQGMKEKEKMKRCSVHLL